MSWLALDQKFPLPVGEGITVSITVRLLSSTVRHPSGLGVAAVSKHKPRYFQLNPQSIPDPLVEHSPITPWDL